MKTIPKVLFFLFLSLQLMNCGQKDYDRILEVGITGKAIINNVEDTRVTVNDNPQVRLYVKIYSKGTDPFDANFKVVVSRVAIPQSGDVIIVKYDPADHQKVIWIENEDLTPEMQKEYDEISL
jgi:hypothetical protein